MRSKFKRSLFTLITLCSINGQQAIAGSQPDIFKQIVSELEKNEAETQSGAPKSSSLFEERPPTGEKVAALPPECEPRRFQEQMLAHYQNANEYGKAVQKYIQRCSRYLTAGNVVGLPGLLRFANTLYDLSQNSLIKKTLLTLSDGTRIEAYIGAKDLVVARPWIIAKCGVFCDISDSSSSLNFVINFFDQSPFNIIFISNHTGAGHIRENGSLTLGGLYEVYDLYDIAHWLKNESPYRHTVQSIHAAGISLGGSSAMAISHLSHLYESHDGKPLFSSTIAICPVVNLGPTLNDMYANSIKGKIFTQYTWQYLKKAAPYLPEAEDYLSAKYAPPSSLFPAMLADIVVRYGSLWESKQPPRRVKTYIESREDFLHLNNFAHNHGPMTIPTLAWASHDDHIVNFELNTKTLMQTANQNSEQGAAGVDYGDHCGFASAYGYSATTAVLQTFILNNSPEFKKRAYAQSVPMPVKLPNLKAGEIHLRQWWATDLEKQTATLFYETFSSKRGVVCHRANPFDSPSSCRKIMSQAVSLSRLKATGLRMPSNKTEAEVLTRQLNHLIHLSHKGQAIDGTQLTPSELSWTEYQ